MSDVKKDHSIGEGTGAVAGAVTGAAIGSAAGPVGSLVGAVAGGVIGAKAGDSIAEAVNPTEYEDHFKKSYTTASYYDSSRDWNDYQPAYKYGYETYGTYRGRDFDSVEPELETHAVDEKPQFGERIEDADSASKNASSKKTDE